MELGYLTEKLDLLESSIDYIDRLVDMSDVNRFGDEPAGASVVGGMNRAEAFNRCMIYPSATSAAYVNELEFRQIIARSRAFVMYNPYAIGAIRNRVSYVVGKGHTYTVRPVDADLVKDETLAACRSVVNEFCTRNQWGERQKETMRRLDRDGERILRIFDDHEHGAVDVRFVEPLTVQSPPGSSTANGVHFGIKFKPGDMETPVEFYICQIDATGSAVGVHETVPAEEIQHLKLNVDRTSPRGLPTWYALEEHALAAARTLKATGKIVEFRARIAMIRKHINATKEGVQAVVEQLKSQAQQQSGTVRTAGAYPYASIIDTPNTTEYQFPADTAPVDKNVAAIQAELRAVAAALGMPEYMLSGDASNANYASTMVAEGPAVKSFEELQDMMIEADLAVLHHVLEVAAAAGLITGATEETICELVRIEAEPPIIKSENRLQEVQADKVLVDAGAMAIETMAARAGLEYCDERQKIDSAGDHSTGYDLPEPATASGSSSGQVGDGAAQVTDPTSAAASGDLQGTALNGAQVSSLLEIIAQVTAGVLTAAAASELILLAFPLLPPGRVAKLMAGVVIPDEQEPTSSGQVNGEPYTSSYVTSSSGQDGEAEDEDEEEESVSSSSSGQAAGGDK